MLAKLPLDIAIGTVGDSDGDNRRRRVSFSDLKLGSRARCSLQMEDTTWRVHFDSSTDNIRRWYRSDIISQTTSTSSRTTKTMAAAATAGAASAATGDGVVVAALNDSICPLAFYPGTVIEARAQRNRRTSLRVASMYTPAKPRACTIVCAFACTRCDEYVVSHTRINFLLMAVTVTSRRFTFNPNGLHERGWGTRVCQLVDDEACLNDQRRRFLLN